MREIIFRKTNKNGKVLRDRMAVPVLLRPDPVRDVEPLGQVLDMEHPRLLVIPGFTHSYSLTVAPKALIVSSFATSHVTREE